MPFTIKKESDKLIIFKFNEKFTEKDFYQFLETLDRLLKIGKPFAFMVDASTSTMAPLKCGISLISWMKQRRHLTSKLLLGSCLVTKYKSLVRIMNWVFKKQKPVSPNLITDSYDKGLLFINESIDKGFKDRLIINEKDLEKDIDKDLEKDDEYQKLVKEV